MDFQELDMAKNKATIKKEIEKLSFEQAIDELTAIVGQIEAGQVPLQESLELYEKGMMLKNHCQAFLRDAEKRINELTEQAENDQDEPDDVLEDEESEEKAEGDEDALF